jgi:hypothetical protein
MNSQSSLSQDCLRLLAYHEAAHVAARSFTKLEFSHFLEVSIVPNEASDGREVYERAEAWSHLKILPPGAARCTGYKLLMSKLAGLACDEMLDPEGEISVFGLPDELPSLKIIGLISDGGDDMTEAIEICNTISRPGLSARRVFRNASRWTKDMMITPFVWEFTEYLANRLLTEKVITYKDRDLSDRMIDMPPAYSIPKWKRRFYAQWKSEAEPLTS